MSSETEWELCVPTKPKRLMKAPEPDILPPHSTEAEQGVLGCIFLEPSEGIGDCIEKLRGGSETFYDLRHRTIYEVCVELYSASIPVELITVQQKLRERGQLEAVGGLAYLASLPDVVPSAANLDYYREILSEKYILRQLIGTCTEAVSRAYDNAADPETIVAAAENDISNLTQHGTAAEQRVEPAEAVNRFTADLDGRILRAGTPSGIITGFHDLDQMTDGLQLGEQFVIGARPSVGKTAVGLNIFSRCALLRDVPTLFISLEQQTSALMRRIASSYCQINMHHLKTGNLRPEELEALQAFNIQWRNSKALIYDFVSTGANAPQIASIVKRCARKHGTKLVVIDYLQKVRPTGKHEKRTYEVADVSGILRSAAVAANVAMITLAQLNRENEKDKGRMPKLTDLADSGQIERDADVVGLLHRDRSVSIGHADLIIAKQRDGETGNVRLHFNGRFCEFLNGTTNNNDPDI
jgi:replicative DNA helicase